MKGGGFRDKDIQIQRECHMSIKVETRAIYPQAKEQQMAENH